MIKAACIFLLSMTTSLFAQEPWTSFKNKIISQMNTLPGWCSDEKAHFMMDIIKENNCQNCVEIGVFSGKSLLPIAKALQYKGSGKVTGVNFE